MYGKRRAVRKEHMERFLEEYSKIIGLILLTFVIIFLLSTPTMILAQSITTIGTELSRATADETYVRTKLDFGNNEHMQAFTKQVGVWNASDYNTTEVAEDLNADVMIMRAYSHPKLYQPVFLLIMQSNDRSSFHPPIVCYPALGYTIEEEETKEQVIVHNISWAAEHWVGPESPSNVTIAVKKLVVAKEAKEDGSVTERRVVLYFYVKERPLDPDTMTMIRVSALIPVEGSYDGILAISKEFMAETIPYMFELQREEEPILFTLLASGSRVDKVALALLFLAPVALIFYPELKKATKRKKAP
jgi:hypothetical protein